MDNAYPLFLSSQTCDFAIPEEGKFSWSLDRAITSRSLKSEIKIQLYNIQLSRQFPNVYGEGCILLFHFNNLPNVKYELVIAQGFYETITSLLAAIAAQTNVHRLDVGVKTQVPNPLRISYDENAARVLQIDNINSTLDLTIEATGLALRLGICNSPLIIPHVLQAPNLTQTLGTWDILFPKQVYICSDKNLQLDTSNDSSLMASRKIIASIPINCNYGEILDYERPFVIQSLKNQSIDSIDIELVDENFVNLPFHNTFALTFMFYKD